MKPHLVPWALAALVFLLAACRSMVPGVPEPQAPTPLRPAAAAASMNRPEPQASPPGTSLRALPLPEVPAGPVEGLAASLGAVPARRERVAAEGQDLPLPVALVSPPRLRSSYELNERGLAETTGVRVPQSPAPPGTAEAPPGGRQGQGEEAMEAGRSKRAAQAPAAAAAQGAAPRTGLSGPPAAPSAGTAVPRAVGSPGTQPATPGASVPAQRQGPEVLREVLARRGDPVELSFPGDGWLFVSATRSGGDLPREPQDGLHFVGSLSDNGRTRFSFAARNLGEYLLSFQVQNHVEGFVRNEAVRLRVLEDEEFERELAGAAGPTQDTPLRQARVSPVVPDGPAGRPPAMADRLFEMGEFALALREYLRGYRADNPHVNERIAESYAAGADYRAAASYYERNLGAAQEYADRAAVGLVRCGLALGDDALLLDTLPVFLAVESQPIQGELLGLARFQQKRDRTGIAMRLLKEYEERYPTGTGLDEVLYRMAGLYESETQLRDLALSRAIYRRIYADWPESPFAEPAHQRLQYLERHFFDVR